MSFLKQGITLKALLQNPELLNFTAPKSVSIKDDDKEKKIKDVEAARQTFVGQSAFLGQNVWNKTVPYNSDGGDFKDYKLEYMDLDEFLNENCIPTNDELSQLIGDLEDVNSRGEGKDNCGNNQQTLLTEVDYDKNYGSPATCPTTDSNNIVVDPPERNVGIVDNSEAHDDNISTSKQVTQHVEEGDKSPKVDVDYDLNPQDLELARVPGQEHFDPRNRTFSEEELRPQPIIKKSRKIFVPDDSKDEKYWHRRNKNNVAAKRSREARRIKENQITLRAAYLEKENYTLKSELVKIRQENESLLKRLSKYE